MTALSDNPGTAGSPGSAVTSAGQRRRWWGCCWSTALWEWARRAIAGREARRRMIAGGLRRGIIFPANLITPVRDVPVGGRAAPGGVPVPVSYAAANMGWVRYGPGAARVRSAPTAAAAPGVRLRPALLPGRPGRHPVHRGRTGGAAGRAARRGAPRARWAGTARNVRRVVGDRAAGRRTPVAPTEAPAFGHRQLRATPQNAPR